MKNFIKEFGEDQANKKIPVKFEPRPDSDEKDFAAEGFFGLFGDEPNNRIRMLKTRSKALRLLARLYNMKKEYGDRWTHAHEKALNWLDNHVHLINQRLYENKISISDLKQLVSEEILRIMNTVDFPPKNCELLGEQKEEIKEKIKLYESRAGFMGLSFHDDFEKDECIIGARVDPTNNKDWVLTKEEVIHKLPYSYKNSLYQLFNEVRKKS